MKETVDTKLSQLLNPNGKVSSPAALVIWMKTKQLLFTLM